MASVGVTVKVTVPVDVGVPVTLIVPVPLPEMVNPVEFVQRDMDCTAMGVPLGQTPFEDRKRLKNGLEVTGIPTTTCYTGDSFVTIANDDVFDNQVGRCAAEVWFNNGLGHEETLRPATTTFEDADIASFEALGSTSDIDRHLLAMVLRLTVKSGPRGKCHKCLSPIASGTTDKAAQAKPAPRVPGANRSCTWACA